MNTTSDLIFGTLTHSTSASLVGGLAPELHTTLPKGTKVSVLASFDAVGDVWALVEANSARYLVRGKLPMVVR